MIRDGIAILGIALEALGSALLLAADYPTRREAESLRRRARDLEASRRELLAERDTIAAELGLGLGGYQ